MRAPSPESSCHSSDCEGDKVVHAMKRMCIEQAPPRTTATYAEPSELRRKTPNRSGSASPMVLVEEHTAQPESETERRKKMMELLQSQLRQYKSQYFMITEGPDIAPCG